MDNHFIRKLFEEHQKLHNQMPGSAACHFLEGIMQLLFPPLSEQRLDTPEAVAVYAEGLQIELQQILMNLEKVLPAPAKQLSEEIMEQLPAIYHLCMTDAVAIADGDPAAQSITEVIRSYPGFRAVAAHRLAHAFYRLHIPFLPRILSEYAHAKTGIDIHPGAKIGSHFCIDHGTGVVIGETTIIGNHVKVYQGVTLGALSVDKAMANIKRHPTIEDYVIIYSGATILGGNTVVGAYSIVGGNVWLTESVPPYSRIYHRPQIKVSQVSEPAGVLNFSI